jgi:hypothetical protein
MTMTVTTPLDSNGPPGDLRVVIGTINFDSSYPTGGEAFPMAAIGALSLAALIVLPKNGYQFAWDGNRTAPKVIAYQQSAATGALTQVPNTTDLSAVTAVQFVAYVRA